MPRLFVALDLPEELKQQLLGLQPPPGRGIRLTKPEQLHLTLHFLGERESAPVIAALSKVCSPQFELTFSGVGEFSNRRGPTILWAGLTPCEPLMQLHNVMSEALRPLGYEPENRPYSPHITLARCDAGTPRRIVTDFLEQQEAWKSVAVPITEFILYSSELTAKGAIYSRLQSFSLIERSRTL